MSDESERMRRALAEQLALLLIERERRLGRGVDRADLARRVHVSKSSLYAYLNGTTLPRTAVFDRLLSALSADPARRRELSTLRDDIEVAQQVRARRDRADAGAAPPAPAVADAGGAVVPRELPPVTSRFVGRAAELARLDALLDEADALAAVIVAIDGTAGVGKTTLALHWAHRVADRYPDGQLYVDLRGFDPAGRPDPGAALYRFLHALGVAPPAIPDGTEARSALCRTLLAERRMLVVLDDAGSAEQVRALLPGGHRCLTIVTGRNRLDSLVVREGAHRLGLATFSYRESLELLERWLGADRIAAQPAAADELLELCARLPLALGIVGARAAARPEGALEALAARLRAAPDRLAVLGAGGGDLDLRAVFHASYALLPDPAARLFRLLGAHAGPDIDGYACAALLDVPEPPLADLDVLTRVHMIAEHAEGRFAAHDLLRAFARDLAVRVDEGERRAAIGRVLDAYLSTAVRAAHGIEPCRDADLPPVERWRPGPPVGDRAGATAWFAAELPVLTSAMELAAAEGFDDHVWRLAWAATVFLRRTGRRVERVALHRLGLDAARRCAGRAVRATSMRLLADGLTRLGRQDEALPLLRTSLAECAAAGETRGAFQAHLSLARLHGTRGAHAEALAHAEDALRLSTAVGDLLARADGLIAVAEQLERLGRYPAALPPGRRALGLYRRIGFAEGEADALRALGRTERRLGRLDGAIERYEQSLRLDRLLGDRFWTGHVLTDLADAYQAAGRHARARASREEALALFESMRHPAAGRVRAALDADPA
ncbi:tetratricopeptide repeat protein [Actinomadura sp. WMMB 499]|uniref:ATP-binding protein n=1 Tax=Actinomadura sp. WMMB 499 TaxID=1219491 RepID=UPI0012461D03|nr:helix-turn-helix domain-containing protein [Actinomadura sp. WMMB 499]QFG22253.1 tetratricopeptide repeat protein [Actinomadura sp. WMMB 499]